MTGWRRYLTVAAVSCALLSTTAVGDGAVADSPPPSEVEEIAGVSSRPAPSRASVRDAYRRVLVPSLEVPIGWNGSVDGCVAGSPSAAAQDATLTAVNYFRHMLGLTPVTFDPDLSLMAQEAALMMQAQGALSHGPGPSWACYSEAGRAGAASGNLYLGVTGAAAVAGYMVDPGESNYFVGHRRWIIDPRRSTMGSGSTSFANSLFVFGETITPPDSTPEWLAWPTEGYFPTELFWSTDRQRWSLSATNYSADFSSASVEIFSAGEAIPVEVREVRDGFGPPTLVFEVDTGFGFGDPDRAYRVTVRDVVIDGESLTHRYTVNLFHADPDAPAFPSSPAGGVLRVSVPEAVGGRTVIGQLAVARASGPGFVTAFGCDDGLPRDAAGNVDRADLNFNGSVMSTASNRLIVQADAAGDVCLYASAGVALIVDVNGVSESGIDSFPNRRTDTRSTQVSFE